MADVFNFYVQDDRSIQFNIAETILLEDKDVTEFQFRIPKSLNGFDMSTWAWWFVYVNPKKEKYSYPLTLTDDEDEPDDYSVATFSINYGITEKEGGIQFALEVIDADAGGTILHEWHTRTYHTAVIWTLQGNQVEYEEDITQDILSSIFEQIAMNKARIDNLTRLPEGSTTADAELMDIRVGADGKIYPTAGEAVRGQVTDLKEDLSDITEDLNGLNVYKRLDIQKSIGLTARNTLVVADSYYYASTLNLPVKTGEKYKVTCKARSGVFSAMFYALNGAVVSDTIRNEDLVDEIITVPSGVDTLYLNGQDANQPVVLKLMADVDDAVLGYVNSEYGETIYEEYAPTINNGYRAYEKNAERTCNTTHTTDEGYHFIELDVEPYDSYKITCTKVASGKTYQVLDETNYAMAESTTELMDTQIDIPSNAYKLVISFYGDITIKKKRYRIANDVTEVNQYITQNTIDNGVFNDNGVRGLINSRTKHRYLWHDNFYRDDIADGLGTNGDANYPMVYSYAGSQVALSGHGAVNTGATKGFAYADMNVADCTLEFSADMSNETYSTKGVGVVARFVDTSNYYYCLMRTTYIRFGKYVSGTQTELGNIYIASPDKAPKKIGFKLKGNRIDVLCNGVIMKTIYDSANTTSTNHGIMFDANALGKVTNFGVKQEIEWQTMLDAMDSGTLPFNIQTENKGKSYNFEIQSETVNGSKTAIRFENQKADNYKRSEIKIMDGRRQLDEQVFSFDIMLAEEYSVVETVPEIIMQMHDTPDSDLSPYGIQPAFSIYLTGGDYYTHSEWSADKKSVIDSSYNETNTNIGSYLDDVGKWVNWKLHVKWAYNDFFEPILELYKDGVLVFASKNPNVVNAAQAPYFKIGIYTFNYVENPSACVSDKRVMYVDNVLAWY